jgi:hypothetical protein
MMRKLVRMLEQASHALPDAVDRYAALSSVMRFDIDEETLPQVITLCSRLATRDSDARVRATALSALVRLADHEMALQPTLYGTTVACLMDDAEEVRMQAVELIWCVVASNLVKCHQISGTYQNHDLHLLGDWRNDSEARKSMQHLLQNQRRLSPRTPS